MADVHPPGTSQQRVGGRHIALDGRTRGDDLERRPRWVEAHRGDRTLPVGGLVLRHGQDFAGGGSDHDDHRLLTGDVDGVLRRLLHRSVQADADRRRRVTAHLVQHVDVGAVLVDRDDAPARRPIQVIGHRLLDLVDQGGREILVGGHHLGLRRDDHPGQGGQGSDDLVVVGLAQRDQAQRPLDRTGLLGQALGIEGVVEPAQHIGDDAGGGHQRAAGLLGVQREVVAVSGHQHVRAAALVHRGTRWIVGAQGECLVLAQPRVDVGGAPTHLPPSVVPDHVQLALVAPGPVLG